MASATATAPITDGHAARSPVAIIVNYRTPELAIDCVDALAAERATLPGLRAILVDGGSGDGSAERLAAMLEQHDRSAWVSLLALPINGGFGYANNQALLAIGHAEASAPYAFLVNPDARPRPGALARLVALMEAHPRAGAVGALLVEEDGRAQGSAFTFPTIRGEIHRGARTGFIRRLLRQPEPIVEPREAARVPWVTGAAVLLRMEALAEVGLFDDGFFLYFEEVELMRRLARAGWEIWHEPAAHVVHIGGAATDVRWSGTGFHKQAPLPSFWYESRRRYFARTGGSARVLAAGAGFLAGRMLWLGRRLLDRRPDNFPLRATRDFVRHSLWPRRSDAHPARLPRLDDAPGLAPAWMKRRG